MSRIALVCLAALLWAGLAAATTYAPVTFGDLVNKADTIFVGQVLDIRPFTVVSGGRTLIKTRVIFSVSERLYGDGSATEVLELLGGELNGVALDVAGMPAFRIGDRHVIFSSRQRSINPIVGFTQGVLRLRRDASGVERVTTYDGVQLLAPTLGQFRDRVRVALTTRTR